MEPEAIFVGEDCEVEKVDALGASSVKVSVKVWVKELQVVPIPPQLALTNVGRIT